MACDYADACANEDGSSTYSDGVCDCGCGVSDPDCGGFYGVDDCEDSHCEDGFDINVDDPTTCVEAYDCNGVSGGEAFTDLCGNCVGGDTGLEACGWNPECNFLGNSTYGDGQGCNCGCGVIDSDCPSYGGEDGGEVYYDVADCTENACADGDYVNPDNPAECLTPVIETDAGSGDGDDAGSSDGTSMADAGSSDGDVMTDAGASDGTGNGSVMTDAGSSDGATDGSVTVDAGSDDGSEPDYCVGACCYNADNSPAAGYENCVVDCGENAVSAAAPQWCECEAGYEGNPPATPCTSICPAGARARRRDLLQLQR